MKTNFLKAKCIFLSFTMVALCSAMISASQYEDEQIRSENIRSENISNEYRNISSNDEMEIFIAKYSGIPVEEIDIDDMRAESEYFKAKMADSDISREYQKISSDEEMEEFIAKYSGIPVEEIDIDVMRAESKRVNY